MFKRNFDFIAVAIVVTGIALIQRVPQLERMLAARTVIYQEVMAVPPPPVDRILCRLASLR